MPARYQVRLYDPVTGLQTAIFDDWNSLYYIARINDYGYHTFSFDGNDARRALFALDSIVEVWRSNLDIGLGWYIDYAGFHRTDQDQITDRGNVIFTSYGRGYEDLLHRRYMLYVAGSAGDVKSGPADDIMKAYVRENAGTLATVVNGRIQDGVTLGLTVAPNLSVGPTWSGSGPWKNLFDLVQEIQQAKLVDFNVVRTGALTFDFRTYFPHKGTDRSGAGAAPAVTFSLVFANMSSPYATVSHSEEANDIIVLGQGEGAARVYRRVQDTAAQVSSPWNRIERTHDSRGSTTNAQLDDEGTAKLNELRATKRISFQVIESLATVYGRDYFLGDIILARFAGAQTTKKVTGAEVTVAEGRENIRIHFDDENATS